MVATQGPQARNHATSHSTGNGPLQKKPKSATEAAAVAHQAYVMEDVEDATAKATTLTNPAAGPDTSAEVDHMKNKGKEPSTATMADDKHGRPATTQDGDSASKEAASKDKDGTESATGAMEI